MNFSEILQKANNYPESKGTKLTEEIKKEGLNRGNLWSSLQVGKIEDAIALRLDYGDDIYQSIEKLCKDEDILTGVIVSRVGTLYKARLHGIVVTDFPGRDEIMETQA